MRFWGNGHKEAPTVVLSGGGSMGALQVGVLRVMMRRGLTPGRIIGSSVGALNGAFLAFYPGAAGVERLADIWKGLEKDRYLHFNPVRLAYRLASRQVALFGNEFLRRLIAQHTIVDDFSAAKVPLYVIATNLNTGNKHVFSSGRVSDAVLASTAIPGVFSPVEINGQTYMDAGILANLDLETAVDLGAREILAIDLSHCFELPEPANMLGVITRTVDIVMRERVHRDMARLGRKANITLIQPEIDRGPGVGDLSHVSRLIAQGEAFAEETLSQCFDRRGRLRAGVVSQRVMMPA
jgi:NTE family protein